MKSHLPPLSLLMLAAVPLLFFVFAYLVPLAERPLLKPDEFRYAEIPREMVESGDWVVPRLSGIRYFEKPVLGYWLTAVSFKYLGYNAFSLRLSSALSTLAAAVMIWLLAAKGGKDPLLAPTATVIFLLFGLVFGVGTFAVLDGQLAGALTFCIGALYFAFEEKRPARILFWLLLAGVSAGGAFLIKGFLALAVPAIVAGPYLLIRREWKKLFLYPWPVLLVAAAVALPWSLSIFRAESDYWNYFVIEEHWKRFTSSTYDRDPQPFWYFIPVLIGGLMPAGLLAFAGWRGWKKQHLKEPRTLFLLCWFTVPFLFFSASSCKLGTYILPCFPPLALLLAEGVRRSMLVSPCPTRKVIRLLQQIVGWFFVFCGVATIPLLWAYGKIPQLPPLEITSPMVLLFGTFAVGLAGALLLCTADRRRALSRLWAFPVGFGVLVIAVLFSMPESVFGKKAVGVGLSRGMETIPISANDLVLARGGDVAAVSWLLKRTDILILGRGGEYRYGLKNYPEYASRQIEYADVPELVKKQEGSGRGVVYILGNSLKKRPLPKDWPIVSSLERHGITVVRLR